MSGLWHWVPGKSIGPFTFGERAEPYIANYSLQMRRPDCSIADWETYSYPGFASWIVVEKGRLIEVHCVDEVEYCDSDLIGMQSSDVGELLGKEDEKEHSAARWPQPNGKLKRVAPSVSVMILNDRTHQRATHEDIFTAIWRQDHGDSERLRPAAPAGNQAVAGPCGWDDGLPVARAGVAQGF